MKNTLQLLLLSLFFSVAFNGLYAQRTEITADQVPKDVINVLNQYLEILTTSATVEEAAQKLEKIAAGSILNNSGKVAQDVIQYSLKKDFNDVKHYKVPAVITRVQKNENDYDGYGTTLFKGTRYKIWIAKKDDVPGLPAPIPVIKPENGTPKIVKTIGSL